MLTTGKARQFGLQFPVLE